MKWYLFAMLIVIGLFFFVFQITEPASEINRADIGDSGSAITGLAIGEGESFLEVNVDNSMIEFEGFGPGKSHVGNFNDFEGKLLVSGGMVVGMEGKILSNSLQVNDGGEKLKNHLLSSDFLDVETHPEISFVSTSFDENSGVMKGQLTFLGVSKEIDFVVQPKSNAIASEFVLDAEPFGLDNKFANSEVRIAFYFSS